MSNATRTVRTFGEITIDEIYVSAFQKKGTETCRIRQEVETLSYYTSMKPTNSMSDNVFKDSEFEGTEEQEFSSIENRVAFINIPTGTQAEEVLKRLKALGVKGRIYRILSNKPILTAEQISAIKNGITTKDVIANSQVARYPENHDLAGQLVLDPNNKVQYRALFFSTQGVEDQDLRTSDEDDQYLTDEISDELANGFTIISEPVFEEEEGMQNV